MLLRHLRLVYSRTGPQMLPAAEGEVKVAHIQGKHTKQYGGQNEPRAFIVFPIILRD